MSSSPATAAGVAATIAAAAAVTAAVLLAQSEKGAHTLPPPPSLPSQVKAAASAVGDDIARALAPPPPPTLASKANAAASSVGDLARAAGGAVEERAASLGEAAKAQVHAGLHHTSSLFADSPMAGVTAEDLHFPAPGPKTLSTPAPSSARQEDFEAQFLGGPF